MSQVDKRFIDFGTTGNKINSQVIPANFESPSNYTPAQVDSEGADKISSHLKGIDTALGLGGSGVGTGTNTITSGNWTPDGELYKQTVTFPSGFTWESCSITCFDDTNNVMILPTLERVDDDNFRVWVNDNSIDVKFRYVGATS